MTYDSKTLRSYKGYQIDKIWDITITGKKNKCLLSGIRQRRKRNRLF